MIRSRAVRAVAGAAVLLLTGTTAAHAAQAAPGQAPEVRWASSVSDDLGTLAVGLRSDSAITEIKAHIVSSATQQEVAVVGDDSFARFSGTAEDGVWRTKEPLKLDALGSYTVHIEATDADGDHTTSNSAGSLAYYVVAQFEDFRTDRTEIDIDHPDVVVEGVLKGRWPGTRELKPLADRLVDIDVDYWTSASARTDAQGRFSASVRLSNAAPVQAVYRHSNELPYVLFGESPATQISVQQVATRWSGVRTTSRSVDYGGQVTVTAKLERSTEEGWVPFAGQEGGVLFVPPPGSQSETVGYFTTADDGTISLTHTPYQGGHFLLTSYSEDPFIAAASARSAEINVLRASRFTEFEATRTSAEQVHVRGSIDFPDGWTPAFIDIRVQFSSDGRHWTEVAATEAIWSGSGNAFSADVTHRRTGYFRAHFRATDSFRSATSASVHVAR
ncbi:hypothetical protein ACFYYH_13740 [Streptomyces sp. NPDC002018]|uniref:hypothetical protein n=1 Tax=Streptomyces sp. NPDC002018 TaxID=3364629 RepID=UPI003683BB8E